MVHFPGTAFLVGAATGAAEVADLVAASGEVDGCCFADLSETTGFLGESGEWTAEIRTTDNGLVLENGVDG